MEEDGSGSGGDSMTDAPPMTLREASQVTAAADSLPPLGDSLDGGPSGVLVDSGGVPDAAAAAVASMVAGGNGSDDVPLAKAAPPPAPYAAQLAAALAGTYAAPDAGREVAHMVAAVAVSESQEYQDAVASGGGGGGGGGYGGYGGGGRTGSASSRRGASRERPRSTGAAQQPASPSAAGGVDRYTTESPRSAYTFPRAQPLGAAAGKRSPSPTAADLRVMALAEEVAAGGNTHAARAAAMAATVAAATVVHKSETGVPSAHFATQLRSGRGLGMSAPRPAWPRPLKPFGASIAGTHSAVPLDADTMARETQRYMHRIVEKHAAAEAQAADTLARSLQAAAAVRAAASSKSLAVHEAEVAAGRVLLDDLTATHLAPFEARRQRRAQALHASWSAAVYAPLRAELEDATTAKFGVISPDVITASVLSSAAPPTRGRRASSAGAAAAAVARPLPRTKEAVDSRDPTRAPLRRVANDEAVVGQTSYVAQLRALGAVVAPDGSYAMPAHVGSTSRHATAHAIVHSVAAAPPGTAASGSGAPGTAASGGSAAGGPATAGSARASTASTSAAWRPTAAAAAASLAAGRPASGASSDDALLSRSPSALALAQVADRMRAVAIATAPGMGASTARSSGSAATTRSAATARSAAGAPLTQRQRVLAATARSRSPRRSDAPALSTQITAVADDSQPLTSITSTLPPRVRMGIATYCLDGSLPAARDTAASAARPHPTGGGAGSSPLYAADGTRALLKASVWGTGVIESTTFAHPWALAGDGLLAPTHPAVAAYARAGEASFEAARDRLQGDFETPLPSAALASTLLAESAGYGPGYRGKKRVPLGPGKYRDMDEVPRGRRRDATAAVPKLESSEVARVLDPANPVAAAHAPPRTRPGLRHVEGGAAAQPDHVKDALDGIARLHAASPPRRHDIIGTHVPRRDFQLIRPDDGTAVLVPPPPPPRTDVAGRPSRTGPPQPLDLSWAAAAGTTGSSTAS